MSSWVDLKNVFSYLALLISDWGFDTENDFRKGSPTQVLAKICLCILVNWSQIGVWTSDATSAGLLFGFNARVFIWHELRELGNGTRQAPVPCEHVAQRRVPPSEFRHHRHRACSSTKWIYLLLMNFHSLRSAATSVTATSCGHKLTTAYLLRWSNESPIRLYARWRLIWAVGINLSDYCPGRPGY